MVCDFTFGNVRQAQLGTEGAWHSRHRAAFCISRQDLAVYLTRSIDHLIELGRYYADRHRKSIAALPLKIYQAGETVLAAGYTTGQLLILRKGLVAVAKEGVEIARVTEPGAVFGEISALLDQPHAADVRALTSSQFHVADAAALLQDPAVLLYVAAILARRLDGANQTLVELMIQVDYPRKMIEKTAKKMKALLGASGVHLPYAGYNLFN
jgi:CRP/FNR family transcriptional regulator, cyclic AMP receptor protein